MTLNIGGRLVGPGQPAWLVAEIGINHGGSVYTALEMVEAAKAAGADALKVQHYHTNCFVSPHATYKGEAQTALFDRYQLCQSDIYTIAQECARLGITFFGTPDCEDGAKWLVETCGAPAIKVGSDDLTNLPLIRAFAGMGVPLILSTGMAVASEIRSAVEAAGNVQLAICHCVSLYPCPLSQAAMLRVLALREAFPDAVIGFSDHTDGVQAAVVAASMGASLIEKHFTLSRAATGPDHAFSADPEMLCGLVAGVRAAPRWPDDAIEPSDEEKAMRVVARRSIRSRFDCKEGTLLTRGHLVFQRPGDGLSPARLDDVLGKYLVRAKAAGDTIGVEDVR